MASSSSACRSAPGSSSRSHRYDVFLSFRGEDTRMRFVDHLYTALVDKQILTFKDDKRLIPGESIGPSLFTAIEESQIALVVFSKNYADSSWCLEELAYVMKCKVERGLIVVPIFYDVEPTDVRKQKGKFEEAFVRHEKENTNKVESWRKGLADASNNVGFDSKNRHESEFIKEVVDQISSRLLPANPYFDEKLVGISIRLEDFLSHLHIESAGVRMVGIWGLGGGGKSTLANSVYTEISHRFNGSCIVEDIGKESSKNYLIELQRKILSDVSKTKVKVQSVAEGKITIQRMLHSRKVLVLLDDVHDLDQLEALAGSRDWFGSGSRIIITTRDQHLLKAHKVDEVCPLKLLSHKEAMELFNKHARNEKEPIKDYEILSLRVVSYAAGLPLALKVLGSFLYDKDEKEWMSALDRLKDIPEMEIVKKLKISYDGLKTEEKELFLDIACFFRLNWYNSKDPDLFNAREIFDACGFHPEIGIKVLTQKALITINENDKFDMHDLVQEMAHYIVRGEHPNNPENHSRVWKKEDIMNMCLGEATKENDTIEAIRAYGVDVDCDVSKHVSNMKKLRWLWFELYRNKYAVDGGPTFLSNELHYIDWRGYPGISFPDSFQPMKLVVLKLNRSLQEVLWKGYKHLPRLKVLRLWRMTALVSTPDFKGLPCLQKLTLDGCVELEEIQASLGNHASLEYVHVSSCHKLRKFPTIVYMEKLQTLEILYCSNIFEFPEIQANMESLVHLSLERVGIEFLPSSIKEHCTNLTSLYLRRCGNLTSTELSMDVLKHLREFEYIFDFDTRLHLSGMRFHQFPRSLQKLDLHECGLEDGKILSVIVELSNLEELDLRWNIFYRLDSRLLQLTQLKILNLTGCSRLVELPELPSSVAILKADYCDLLTAVGDSFTNCKCLCQVSLEYGGVINDGDRVLESMLQGKAIENGTSMLLRLTGGLEIAKGFTPCVRDGNICRLQLPENWRNEYCGFLMCAVGYSSFKRPYVRITGEHVKSGSMDDDVFWAESDCDRETWAVYVSFASLTDTNAPWWDQTYNQLLFCIKDCEKTCSGFGVRLVGKKNESGISGSKDSSQFSNYRPDFSIDHFSDYSMIFISNDNWDD